LETLIDEQRNNAIYYNEELFFSTLIRSYGRASLWRHASRTFFSDIKWTPRSVLSFNTFLSPDKISYGILIKSYCEAGLHGKAIEIMMRQMEEGEEQGVNTIALTTILSSLYMKLKGEVEVAENLWNEMVKKKGCEVMDNSAYNVRLMNAALKESPERVLELIQEMSNMGLKPDTISYNCLVTAYCEKGMFDEAEKVFDGLQGNICVAPNVATFRTLILHLCCSGLYEQGYAVFKKSVYVHKIPDFDTLQHLVVGLVRNKKINDANGLIRTAKNEFPPSFLDEWEKLEEELGLVSKTDASSSSAQEHCN
ncbi:hypothetical protein EUTSA_v10017741mg, partial [Eutrema salsugineum]